MSYPYQEYSPVVEEKGVGMGVLSRYPLVNPEYFKLMAEGVISQQKVMLQYDEQTIILYNIHLTFPQIRLKRIAHIPWLCYPWYDTEIRQKEIKQLLLNIKQQKAPLIVAGDFNCSDRSKEYSWLAASLADVYGRSGESRGCTWPVWHRLPIPPFLRIDYLFHSIHFHPYSAQLAKSTGSDHLPLFVEIAMEI